jgi:hypothetical protein
VRHLETLAKINKDLNLIKNMHVNPAQLEEFGEAFKKILDNGFNKDLEHEIIQLRKIMGGLE